MGLKDTTKGVVHTCRETASLLVVVYRELWRTRVFTIAAALAFYFLLSLVPLIVIFSSLLQFLPIPDVFQKMLDLMAELVPADSMTFVESLVASVLTPARGKLLSFGVAGYLWAAAGGFSSLIEALNIAYDVADSRAWWRDRLRALVLTFTSGGLVSASLLMLIAGPRFGHFLTEFFPAFMGFEHVWPVLRLGFTFLTFVVSLELIYYLGPNAKHSFSSTQPGALFAIAVWFLGSTGLSFYLGHLSNYNATYGSMGALVGLMLWFYLTGLAILIGAELNAELAKRRALQAGAECVIPAAG
ncbi:membrane protein [Silvibacterium bohemicum]|uniref:Membrane protein n=1 Tax=Silvibacterium bohemicum TaxID=1577686 RepID=A0A841JLW4_9BACT|nr:YihY/virulence factor BrkB family protein [Silvibacterium bohemicum]MBB6142110.1 membrane protein [Silvibacterium bohemicum]